MKTFHFGQISEDLGFKSGLMLWYKINYHLISILKWDYSTFVEQQPLWLQILIMVWC